MSFKFGGSGGGGGGTPASNTIELTASGSIANGKPCIINTDGTVSQAGPVAGKSVYFNMYWGTYQFTLATPFTTASTPDGTYSQANSANNAPSSYTQTSTAGHINYSYGSAMKPDGTKILYLNRPSTTANSAIKEFHFGTAYDITTLTYDSSYTIGNKTTHPNGMAVSPDGTEVYVCTYGNSNIHQWTLSTGWDISTASFTRTHDVGNNDYLGGITFKPDGTKMYVCGGAYGNDKKVWQYTLSTAWDISTESYDSVLLDVSSYDSNPHGVFFNDDGTKLYICGNSGSTIIEYSLSTAYVISSASFVSETSTTPATSTYGINFGNGPSADNNNYIGFSDGAYTNGQTATIKVIGNIDTNHSGLTPNALCYADINGTVRSTETGCTVGQALTPTTVLIKGQYKMLFD